ncbi:hypothetical protein PUN28_003637 [Cardiocondyla obscurior]|uniref:Secreted protein n=1 Tax=Cardiocondyla obscurior TaxID=286306 RepID=A0AAW2GLM1_9HYME
MLKNWLRCARTSLSFCILSPCFAGSRTPLYCFNLLELIESTMFDFAFAPFCSHMRTAFSEAVSPVVDCGFGHVPFTYCYKSSFTNSASMNIFHVS